MRSLVISCLIIPILLILCFTVDVIRFTSTKRELLKYLCKRKFFSFFFWFYKFVFKCEKTNRFDDIIEIKSSRRLLIFCFGGSILSLFSLRFGGKLNLFLGYHPWYLAFWKLNLFDDMTSKYTVKFPQQKNKIVLIALSSCKQVLTLFRNKAIRR